MYLKPDWLNECVTTRLLKSLYFHAALFFCTLFFFIGTAQIVNAQDTRVVAELATSSSQEAPIVLLKWYSRDILYDEGVFVYRRKEKALDWTRINDKPILRKANVSAAVLAADPDMEAFVSMVKSATKKDLQEGMFVFNVVVKSFQSNEFAEFMGIYLEDRLRESGRYEYKVNRVRNGKEVPLGLSPVIEAGAYKPSPPIADIEIFQKGKKLNFNWTHDEERFYAVNIYRKAASEPNAIKLNENPIMLSQVTDSAGNIGYPKPMFSEDKKLRENEIYTYQLAGVGFFGQETQLSDPVRVRLSDVTPPPAPRNFQAKADSMKVHLSWENVPVSDLEGMHIHRSSKSDGPYEIITQAPLPASITRYDDTLSIPGPYYYFVSSNDTTGNQSHSDLMFVEVQDVMPPLPPTDLKIETDTGKIVLTWKMGVEPDLAGYYIYRTVDSNSKTNYVLINAEPLKADKFEQALPKNVKNEFFYYLVAADTSYNRSKPSTPVSGRMPDILAPEKPFIKTVTTDGQDLIIEWIRNVDLDLAGYHVFRADSSKQFERVNVNLLGRETFRYTDRETTANTDYYYYLVALDSAGNVSIPSKEKYGRRIEKEQSQAGAIAVKVKYNKRKKASQLTWKYENPPAALMGYVVYRGEDEKRMKPITGMIKDKSFTDKERNRIPGAQYYQVRAYQGERVIFSSIIKQNL